MDDRPRRALVLLVLFGPLTVLYLMGGLTRARIVNTDMTSFDQSAYLDYAKKMQESGYSYVGDRNRMPVYPFLLSLLHRPGVNDAELFERAKRFNLVLSVVLLAGIYLILRRSLPLTAATSLVVITAFMVFLFKASYVQCELLYYFFSFCAFRVMLSLLTNPEWKRALAAGSLAGITHLTKASALPGLVIFLFCAACWFGYQALRSVRPGRNERRTPKAFGALALTALAFLVVVFPYIRTSKRVFGHYFYNVNSTFYIWYDTQDQVVAGTRAHGDRTGWPRMPPEEIPGPRKYLEEHSPTQIMDRIAGGVRLLHQTALKSYGYYKYVHLYAGFALLVVALRPRAWWPLEPGRAGQILFCAFYFSGYVLLFAWASASLWGANRMSLQLFLPFMFCLASIISASTRTLPPWTLWRFSLDPARIFDAAMLGLVAPEIYVVLTTRLTAMAGGH